jgi:hypothetical protein
MSDVWYYAEDGRKAGPFTLEGLKAELVQKQSPQDILVWQDGYPDWKRAGDVAELSRTLPPPFRPADRVPERPATGPERKAPRLIDWLAPVVMCAIAYGFGRILGIAFWLPLLGVCVSYWILTKSKVPNPLVPTLALTMGHGVWFALPVLVFATREGSEDLFWQGLIETSCLAALVGWVWARKSRASLICLLAYQASGLLFIGYNALTLPMEFATVMHMGLRVLEVGSSIYALTRYVEIANRHERNATAT